MKITVEKEDLVYCSGDVYVKDADVEIGICLIDGSKIELIVDENKLELLEIALKEAKQLLNKKEEHKKALFEKYGIE